MIDGVKVKQLKCIPDERGTLTEILRCDDEVYEQFGMCYVTTAYHGVTKAWHYHKLQTDHFFCLKGMAKVVLYDDGPGSKTYGEVNEFFMGIHNHILVKIPKLVYHGYKCISTEDCAILNIPTMPYNYKQPDEYRLAPHNNDVIPYDWSRADK